MRFTIQQVNIHEKRIEELERLLRRIESRANHTFKVFEWIILSLSGLVAYLILYIFLK